MTMPAGFTDLTADNPPGLATVDLSHTEPFTPAYLRQWVAVYNGQVPLPNTVFANGKEEAKAQIVQLVAAMVAAGTAYYSPGDVTAAELQLARKLNSPNVYSLNEPFLTALHTGQPLYARSIGVKSSPIV